MARLPRLSIPGQPHLLLQRARAGGRLFVDDVDRRHYLDALAGALRSSAVALHAYVLMDDHVHLLATPAQAASLGRAMQRLGRRYVAAFNARHGLRGSPFEGRFRAAVIEPERYLLASIRHLELNPVRHGWVALPEDYAWSSAAHHAGTRRDPLISEHPLFWRLGNTPFDREAAWRAISQLPLDPRDAAAMRAAAGKGWALGGDAFLVEAAKATGRRLVPLKRGRRPV